MPYKDIKKRNDYNKEYLRKWRKENAEKQRGYDASRSKHKVLARAAVTYALKTGKLVRPDVCSRCDVVCIPEAHHPDHDKRLEVVWLCSPCHRLIEKGV